MAWTKEERREYMKRYREENKEQIRANKRYWLDRHREENRQYQRELYKKNKDIPEYMARMNASAERYRENNREKINAKARERYYRNKLQGVS